MNKHTNMIKKTLKIPSHKKLLIFLSKSLKWKVRTKDYILEFGKLYRFWNVISGFGIQWFSLRFRVETESETSLGFGCESESETSLGFGFEAQSEVLAHV